LATVLLFGVTTACGSSGGKRPVADGGGADAAGPDRTASDVVTWGPDSMGGDTPPTSTPDAVGTSDMLLAGPEAGALDGRDVGSEATGSDAVKQGLDAIRSDAVRMGPDSSPSDGADSGFDGSVVGMDSRVIDLGLWTPDGATHRDEIIHACALAASCASYVNGYSASRCLRELGKTASREDDLKLNHLLKCAQASTCSAFNGCWGGDLFTLDPFVQDGQCSGNSIKVTPAGASRPQFLDCSAMGGACEGLATGVLSVACNARSCSGAGAVAPTCDGSTASGCGGWAEYTSLDCAWSGRKCQVEGSHANCAGTGTSCSDTDKVTCAGSVATYCSRGARATVDCAKTGSATRCAEGAPSTEPCTAAGTECEPAAYVDQCDGNRLVVCADGLLVSVGCNDLGLVLCYGASVGSAQCHPGV
jgi:hypothetical protein